MFHDSLVVLRITHMNNIGIDFVEGGTNMSWNKI